MSFFNKLFGAPAPINSYEDFWNWFQKNEAKFFQIMQQEQNIEKDFFNVISPKLKELKDGIFFLVGKPSDSEIELILTADGQVKNFAFIEDIVAAAPTIKNWTIRAHKPAIGGDDFNIQLGDFPFSVENMHFFAEDAAKYPDEIDITIVHNDFTEENKDVITNGTYIFLDNYLGELHFAMTVDNLVVTGKEGIEKELVPLTKLKEYLTWREAEFIEKYKGARTETNEDAYAIFQGNLQSGETIISMINTDLLKWDRKPSHPWIVRVDIDYPANDSGMPSDELSGLLNTLEDELNAQLKAEEGYLNVGRETGGGIRQIYFACKDFRKPSRAIYEQAKVYKKEVDVDYSIYKDKYWRTFERFEVN